MKNILIVTKAQYGYHIDPYKFGYYLKKNFEITHLSWDFGLPIIKIEGIRTKYITREGNKAIRYMRFLTQINQEIRTGKYDLVFLVYFIGCSFLLRKNPGVPFNIDVRTATDTDSKFTNKWKDGLLKWECSQFENLSILSHGLAEKLGFKKYHFLPLGGEKFCDNHKTFEQIHLLYVGTLENRNLLTFIRGLHQFLQSRDTSFPSLSFTIIGDGPGNERRELDEYIRLNSLNDKIETTGYIHNDQLKTYFEKANIGVSYVPITPYYTHQPPTKTYEYLLSGLPVLATATIENARIIDDSCGVLIQDNEEDIERGLFSMVKQLKNFNSEKIRKVCSGKSWLNITQSNLVPYLKSILKSKKSPSQSVN